VDYQPAWLDELCLTGEIGWVRLTPRGSDDEQSRGSTTPSAATPLTLAVRTELPWMLQAVRSRHAAEPPVNGDGAALYQVLDARGAQFRHDMADLVGILPSQVDDAVWDLVARGLLTADAFSAVRSLLSARQRLTQRGRSAPLTRRASLGVHRAPSSTGVGEGRWSLVTTPDGELDELTLEDLGDAVAVQMLQRWGIVTYDLVARESFGIPWRYVARALRRRESAGQILAGRFVAGLAGEQFAMLDALPLLQRDEPVAGIRLSACDPLNLTGPLLQGERVAARPNLSIRVANGTVVATD